MIAPRALKFSGRQNGYLNARRRFSALRNFKLLSLNKMKLYKYLYFFLVLKFVISVEGGHCDDTLRAPKT